MAKEKMPEKDQRWVEARKRYRLSHAHVHMARELGLNPKKFGALTNTKEEPWSSPLAEFIEDCVSNTSRNGGPRTYAPSSRW